MQSAPRLPKAVQNVCRLNTYWGPSVTFGILRPLVEQGEVGEVESFLEQADLHRCFNLPSFR